MFTFQITYLEIKTMVKRIIGTNFKYSFALEEKKQKEKQQKSLIRNAK